MDTDQSPLHVHILKCATGLWQGEAALCPTVSVSLEPIEPKAKALGVNVSQGAAQFQGSRGDTLVGWADDLVCPSNQWGSL